MTKQVTRKVVTYTYNLGKISTESGKPEIVDQISLTFSEKIGQKKMRKYLEENNIDSSYIVVSVKENIATYAMPLDQFLENAVIVNKENN